MPDLHRFSDYGNDNDNDNDCIRYFTDVARDQAQSRLTRTWATTASALALASAMS